MTIDDHECEAKDVDDHPRYEMIAPDGTTIYRVPIYRSGWMAARWKGRVYPVLGGIHGPLFMSTAWGSSKA